MPKFDESWTGKLRQIGDLERPDHVFLRAEDECAFLGAYTARAGFGHSSTNDLIFNLKKPMARRGQPGWSYKARAIQDAARALRGSLNADNLPKWTIVPIPPSKPVDHPDHDDRVAQIAHLISPGHVREVIRTSGAREARHLIDDARSLDGLRATLTIDEAQIFPRPSGVILLDDVLTTGCSFRVCRSMIAEIWPQAVVFGLFVARVARPRFDDWNDDF